MNQQARDALRDADYAARRLTDLLGSARRIGTYAWNATPHIEEAWILYHELGNALRAAGVEPLQPPDGSAALGRGAR